METMKANSVTTIMIQRTALNGLPQEVILNRSGTAAAAETTITTQTGDMTIQTALGSAS
jgi:hypothetical protein